MELNSTLFNDSNIGCLLPHPISEDQWVFYNTFAWWVEGFGSVLIGLIGIFFNTTTIFVLLGSELAANFFNWLLVCLAVFDSFFLLNGILEALRTHLDMSTNFHTFMFAVFLFPFRSIVMCCSIYTTVLLALERYNALVRPISNQVPGMRVTGKQSLKVYFLWHRCRLFKYITPIVVLATIFYFPKLLEVKLVDNYELCLIKNETSDSCNREYEIELTELKSNNHYILWYQNVSNILITAVVPFVSLIYLNANIYLKFKEYIQRQPRAASAASNAVINQAQERSKKREKDMVQQTMILFAIVILFGLFNFLRIILNINEFLSHDNDKMAIKLGCEWLQYWTIIAAPVSHLLLQINSSINFFIYCLFNKGFRDELLSRVNVISSKFVIKQDLEDVESIDAIHLTTLPATKMTTVPNKDTVKTAKNGDIENAETIELI